MSALLILLLALAITACGDFGSFDVSTKRSRNNGSGGNSFSHPPSLSNLACNPETVNQGDYGGSVSVLCSFNWYDSGRDIRDMTFILYDSEMNRLDYQASTVTGANLSITGTLYDSNILNTTVAGIFYFTITVTDSEGAQSNALEGTFTVN